MTSPRKRITAPDIRFEDEKLNRLMQHVRALTQELSEIQGAIAGGQAGQVLRKRTSGDYDTEWQEP